jgi:hypothetical protein
MIAKSSEQAKNISDKKTKGLGRLLNRVNLKLRPKLIIIFLIVMPQDRKGKILSTSAIIQMILVLMLIGTLHHMAKIYDTKNYGNKKLQGMSAKLL